MSEITIKQHSVALTAMWGQSLSFATGGYDHLVHLWDVQDDLISATCQPLAIKHTAQVQSLLSIHDTSRKLISASSDCNAHIWDLSSERVVNTLKASNSIFHLHKTRFPHCTLLEVAHRELQFEIRDHRLVPEEPVLRFGYPTAQTHGRYIRGDYREHAFACGARDGTIRVWDTRNIRAPCNNTECLPGEKIVQVVFTSSHLIACSIRNQFTLVPFP
ncbi:hypothetical protein BDN72DRAFT_867796 [Pluteus cervinus]|uniref:Uncharacterized protein n=1 Tax=Pluteus cervinus TaxID=181527 RepID=A0ACD3BDZ6_9AGAR|nr:hypothetical protein BDN72DRAFT_867796 [Pluteus cervinus]